MSRSGYTDDWDDNWALIKWRGQVASAIRGARGQKFLRDLIAALDALPEKRLVADALQADGSYCAMGAVMKFRGLDPAKLDPEEPEAAAEALDIAHQLAKEVAFENDDDFGFNHSEHFKSDEVRWSRMRAWAVANLKPTPPATQAPGALTP